MSLLHALVWAMPIVAAAAPTITAVSSDLVDTAGGDVISVLGTNMSGTTLQTSPDNTTWTDCTSTSSTSTTSTGTAPAVAAGSLYVRAKNGALFSNVVTIEAWNPTLDVVLPVTGCWDKGGFSGGTWTPRAGTTTASAAPASYAGGGGATDAGGYPSFNGSSQYLAGDTTGHLMRMVAPCAMTIAVITTPTAAAAQSNPYNEPAIWSDAGRGAYGLSYSNRATTDAGVPGFTAFATDGSYKTATAPAALNVIHSVIMRMENYATVDLSVDGLNNTGNPGFQSTAITTISGSTTETMRMGAAYGGSFFYSGSIRAYVLMQERATARWCTKFRKWGAVRHGAGAPTLGVPWITSHDVELPDTLGGQTITLTVIGAVTSLKLFDSTGANTALSFVQVDATHISFTSPAKSKGTYSLVAANAVGSSMPFFIEFYDPSAVPAANSYLDARRSVTTSGANIVQVVDQADGTTVWAPFAGSGNSGPPTLLSGFSGTKPGFHYAPASGAVAAQALVRGELTTVASIPSASFFCAAKWTNTDATYDSYVGNPPLSIAGDTTGGVVGQFGASAGVLRRTVFNAGWNNIDRGSGLNDGNPRMIGFSYDTSAGTQALFVGATQQGAAAGPAQNTSYSALGGGYAGSPSYAYDGFRGDIGWAVNVSTLVLPMTIYKLNRWSQQTWGTP